MTENTKRFRRIIIGNASSSGEEIRFYLNDKSHSYIKGKRTCYGLYIKLERPNKKISIKDKKTFKKVNIMRILFKISIALLLSSASILLFALLFNICNCYFNNISLSCIFTFVFISLFLFTLNLFIHFMTESTSTSFSVKSNHSAEHMIINFIEKHQRLPISMKELKKSSRFHPLCGSITNFKQVQKVFIFPMALNLGLTLYLLLIKEPSFLLIKLIILFLMFGCICVFIKKKVYLFFEVKLNFLLQLSNTTRNVSSPSLILAYFVARKYILHKYPEYANEYWMKHSEFLDNYKVKKSKKAS